MAIKYLKKFGHAVIENGYDICFIRPGEKRPFGKDWEATKHGPKRTTSAIEGGKASFGVGIKTKHTPLIDIDCYDLQLIKKIRREAIERFGEGLERTGMAPKLGMVYRARKPFPKTQSKVFIDDEGRPVKLEILGDGQQFVAYATHPDTGKPYSWSNDTGVADIAWEDLNEIDREGSFELVDIFERECRKRGWPEKSTVKRLAGGRSGDVDLDDPFISDKPKVDIADDLLRAKLQTVPNSDDYDTWFHVGMALFHQYDGSDEGLMLWHEWSSQAHNYESDSLDDKWKSFDVEGKKREPITARFILKQAKAEEERLAVEELAEVQEDIQAAADLAGVKTVCNHIKTIAFDQLLREQLAGEIKERIKKISGTTMSITSVRQMIKYENPENRTTPKWLEEYVYIQEDETFYSTKTHTQLSTKAFDSTFNRYMMTRQDRLEGRSYPENSASQVALNRYEIPIVANRMYMPGESDIFNVDGLDYVNSYQEGSVPDMPEKLSKRHRRAIRLVEKHLEHLFVNERDRKLLLSWMAYIVQNNKRVNWAPIIQGIFGDGKSFFHLLMGAVLGSNNVRTIGGDALAEKNTAWAEGTQLCFFEEVRLHGKDRFAVVNKVKPYITNKYVSIRRMSVDWYQVLNTVSYMLTTNHKDGMPVGDADDRYFPLFSRWQSKTALRAFNKLHPTYYKELHEALEEPGALRKWLMDYTLHADFNPIERATVSSSKAEMSYLNLSDDEEAFQDAIKHSENHMFSAVMLDSALTADALVEHGGFAPSGRGLKMLLSEAGFTYLGVVKIEGKTRRLWSQEPERWRDADGVLDTLAIRKWAKNGDPDDI